MGDSVRVSVETDREGESVRIHDDSGEVTSGGTTFRFSVSSASSDPSDEDTPAEADHRDADEQAESRYIGPLSAVPSDGTLRCEAVNGKRGTEFILQRAGGEVLAWRNSCPHEPKVRLDLGNGAIVDDGQLVCHKHGARFGCGDGFCTYGPCRGEALDAIEVDVQDGEVYLSDDRFEACYRLD